MAGSSDTADASAASGTDDFGGYYTVATHPALRRLEQAVLGTRYGGNSYTDVDQARVLGALLGLRPGATLLDLGAGEGWPGLFLAREWGCRVVLLDRSRPGLAIARAAASADQIDADAMVGVGARLPFRVGSFDAVTHSDVMC